jgi:structural maintenance of chromosome 2
VAVVTRRPQRSSDARTPRTFRKTQTLGTKEKEGASAAAELASKGAAVEKAAAAMASLKFDPQEAAKLGASRQATAASVRAAQDTTDRLRSQLGGVEFQFSDPEAGFDRGKVKGRVVKLLQLRDPAAATALEVVAGGKLWQVVVDSDATSKALIDKGRLRQRVTIIPLNRIQHRTPTDGQLSAAARTSNGDARSALSLVGFEDDVAAAMRYVFGNAFVASARAQINRSLRKPGPFLPRLAIAPLLHKVEGERSYTRRCAMM